MINELELAERDADALRVRDARLSDGYRWMKQLSGELNGLSLSLGAVAIMFGGGALILWSRDEAVPFAATAIALVCLGFAVSLQWTRGRAAMAVRAFSAGLREAGFKVDSEGSFSRTCVSDIALDAVATSILFAKRTREVEPKRDQAEPYTFAWTPPGSRLGTIVLREKPTMLFTRDAYDHALAEHLDRMFDAADEDDQRLVIREIERQEPGLRLGSSVGSALVMYSEWLRPRVHFPSEGIEPSDMEHDADALVLILDGETSICEYVAELYHDPDY